MLGAEERDDGDAGRGAEDVNRAHAAAITARRVRDEADAPPLQQLDPSRSRTSTPVRTEPVAAAPTLAAAVALIGEGLIVAPDSCPPRATTVATSRRSLRTSPLPSGVERAREHHDGDPARGIDPQRGAGEPGVPVAAELAAGAGEARVDVPAESALAGAAGEIVRRGHRGDGARGEDRAPPASPRSSNIVAKRATSSTVENNPA